jgi:SAM-dependent methyltransferase
MQKPDVFSPSRRRRSVCNQQAVQLGPTFDDAYTADMSAEFWNERYSAEKLVYGDAPNEFLASMANRLPKYGQALDIGAGEGRNALFLASRGLNVLAVDQSEVGMQKAQRLAQARGLSLRTEAADLQDFDAELNSFDVVTSIFVHLPAMLRALVHRRARAWLKLDGLFLLEAYAPDQIERDTGGPKDSALLAPLNVIVGELADLTIEHQAALVRNVCEGSFHSGEASVVQVLARKR